MAGRVVSPIARSIATATAVSATLHLLILATLVADACWPFLLVASPAPRPTGQVRLIATLSPTEFNLVVMDHSLPQWATRSTSTVHDDSGAMNIADHEAQERVARRVTIAVEQASQQSGEENLAQLKQLTGKLDRLSSRQSVDDLAQQLGQWLGTAPRAIAPADVADPEEFDYATAQLHDLRRQRDEQGDWSYAAVLIDRQGRTRESLLTPEEGADAYQTMQLMKSSPLAELIYRRIAMGLLDDIIRTAKAAEELAGGAAPMPQATADNSAARGDMPTR